MKLELTFRFDGTARVGSGEPPMLAHLPQPFFRSGGSPVIPGSSIKGVLRKACLRFFSEICKDDIKVVPPCRSVQPSDLKKHFEEHKDGDIVARIFGCPGHRRAKIRISDAIPGEYKVVSLSRVGIKRDTGTAELHRLFSEEIIIANEFKCTLETLEELDEEEMLFLLRSFGYVPYIGLGSQSRPFSLRIRVLEEPRGGFPPKAKEILKELAEGVPK